MRGGNRQAGGQFLACFQQIIDAAMEQFGTERLGQVGVCTCGIAFLLVVQGVFGCQQYDGNMAGPDVILD